MLSSSRGAELLKSRHALSNLETAPASAAFEAWAGAWQLYLGWLASLVRERSFHVKLN